MEGFLADFTELLENRDLSGGLEVNLEKGGRASSKLKA